jgi:hypothetical protein
MAVWFLAGWSVTISSARSLDVREKSQHRLTAPADTD